MYDYSKHCEFIDFDGRLWVWPKLDDKLKQVNDWVDDIRVVLAEMDKVGRGRNLVIQAGGACGVWPVKLASYFKMVYTYEPDHLNYWCLLNNISGRSNIIAKHAAIGQEQGFVKTVLHSSEMNNAGAYYTVPWGDDSTSSIQSTLDEDLLDNQFFHEPFDLICLDIEGREIEALKGAEGIIRTHAPFIMLEEKQLPQMGSDVLNKAGEATSWLQTNHNYRIAAKVHRDVILAPPT